MKRSPLCGRNFEYFSEDPLPGRRAGRRRSSTASSRQGVGTSVKHFAANNQETDRLRVGRRGRRADAARDLPAGVRAGRHGVPAVDGDVLLQQGQRHVRVGEPVAAHRGAARGVGLRGARGVRLGRGPRPGRRARGRAGPGDAAQPAAQPRAGRRGGPRRGGVGRGPRRPASAPCSSWWTRACPSSSWTRQFDADAHHALARAAAAESVVLLKNDGALLPLRRRRPAIAVIGEFARTPRFQGAGSSQVNPTRVDAPSTSSPRPFARGRPFAAGFGIGDTGDDEALRAEAVDVAGRRRDRGHAARAARRRRVRGLRPHPHATCPPTSSPPCTRSRRPTRTSSSCSSTARPSSSARSRRTPRALLEAWLGGQAAGGGDRRRADRRGQPVRPAGRDHPAPARGQLLLPELPGRLPGRALRRGAVHRLPRLRRHAHRRRVPVRVRAVLHDVRAVRPERRDLGVRRRRQPRRRRSRSPSPTPDRSRARRSSRSTSATPRPRSPGRCAS